MKTPFALFILLAASATATAAPHSLLVEVQPRFANAPLMFDAMTNVTAAGQTVSVTRLDFLLSNIALRRADGTWFTLTNRFGYISGRERRTMVALPSLPPGDYGRIRFHVGVPERENHANPGALAASHPLNLRQHRMQRQDRLASRNCRPQNAQCSVAAIATWLQGRLALST